LKGRTILECSSTNLVEPNGACSGCTWEGLQEMYARVEKGEPSGSFVRYASPIGVAFAAGNCLDYLLLLYVLLYPSRFMI
jgi:hypothetical protein